MSASQRIDESNAGGRRASLITDRFFSEFATKSVEDWNAAAFEKALSKFLTDDFWKGRRPNPAFNTQLVLQMNRFEEEHAKAAKNFLLTQYKPRRVVFLVDDLRWTPAAAFVLRCCREIRNRFLDIEPVIICARPGDVRFEADKLAHVWVIEPHIRKEGAGQIRSQFRLLLLGELPFLVMQLGKELGNVERAFVESGATAIHAHLHRPGKSRDGIIMNVELAIPGKPDVQPVKGSGSTAWGAGELIEQLFTALNVKPKRCQLRTRLKSGGPAVKPRILMPFPSWEVSGVNTFAEVLARGALGANLDVEILFTSDSVRAVPAKHLPKVPYSFLPPRDVGHQGYWDAMAHVASATENTIVVMNYDFRMNVTCSKLPSSVGVLGILHSDDPAYYEQTERLGRYWNRIACVSDFIRSELNLINPVLGARAETIRYGVPPPPLSARKIEARIHADEASPTFNVLYLGRIVQEQKRVLDLIEVVKRATATLPQVRFTIVGDGQMLEHLRTALAEPIAAGVVRAPGRMNADEVARLLPEHHALILTSEFEGLPLALCEAMGHGLLPIMPHIRSGIPEVIEDGVSGRLVPCGDIAGFVKAIAESIDDRARTTLQRIEASKQFYAKGLDEGSMTAAYLDLFDRIIVDIKKGYERPKPWNIFGKEVQPLPPGLIQHPDSYRRV
jgi:glycosyltransferase involved in cell wall biosynthesis